MSDKLEIIHGRFDTTFAVSPMTRLESCAWSRAGKYESGWNIATPGEKPSIPDDVRIALAMLVAPGLVCPVGEPKGEA